MEKDLGVSDALQERFTLFSRLPNDATDLLGVTSPIRLGGSVVLGVVIKLLYANLVTSTPINSIPNFTIVSGQVGLGASIVVVSLLGILIGYVGHLDRKNNV